MIKVDCLSFGVGRLTHLFKLDSKQLFGHNLKIFFFKVYIKGSCTKDVRKKLADFDPPPVADARVGLSLQWVELSIGRKNDHRVSGNSSSLGSCSASFCK